MKKVLILTLACLFALTLMVGCGGGEEDAATPTPTEDVGNEPEGNEPEGNEPEGNEPEGNEPEGNEPEGNEPEGGIEPAVE